MLGNRTSRWTAVAFASLALSLATLAVAPLALAQSSSSDTDNVAAAARKSREDKKNAPKDKKVYTDDDVKPAAPDPSAQPSAPANGDASPASAEKTAAEGDKPAADGTKAAEGESSAPADKSPDKNDEKAWRQKFRAQRDQIARAEKELDVLQREDEKAQIQYYPDPQKALEEGYSRKEINEKETKIAAKKDEIAKLKAGLDDLEDQLRKSGGDPGWASE